MNLEEKKFLTDSFGKEADILKAQIEIIHKKLLLFLGIGAGSWIYAIKFYEANEIFLTLVLSVSFIFAGLGNLISIVKLSKLETKLKKLEEEIKNVR
jgi:hypothetical protein